MSNIKQVLTKEGLLANIIAGQRVRINPGLRGPKGEVLRPDDVTVGEGFLLASKDNGDGTFDVQSLSSEQKDLQWTATNYYSTQYMQSELQTDVGPFPGANPSPVDPILIGSTIMNNTVYCSTSGSDQKGNGTFANPFRQPQTAVDWIIANGNPSVTNPWIIALGGANFDSVIIDRETIVITGYLSAIQAVNRPAIIYTNATRESIETFLANGGWFAPDAHYTDLIPNGFEVRVGVLSGFYANSSANPPGPVGPSVMVLGVGDATDFMSFNLFFNNMFFVGGVYGRNANQIRLSYCEALVGLLQVFNVSLAQCQHSHFAEGVVVTYDDTVDEPIGGNAEGLTGSFNCINGPVTINKKGKLHLFNCTYEEKVTINDDGQCKFDPGYVCNDVEINDNASLDFDSGHILGKLDVADDASCVLKDVYVQDDVEIKNNASLDFNSGYILGNLDVAGDASSDLSDVHVQGDMTYENAGAKVACTMDGGRYMGTLTDVGVRLTRNVGN